MVPASWRVAFRISPHQTRAEARALIDDAYVSEGLFDAPFDKLPVIVNDRGPQMKAKPLQPANWRAGPGDSSNILTSQNTQ